MGWCVGGAGARGGEWGRTGDGAAELGKLPGSLEVAEKSGEEGSSTRARLERGGWLGLRGGGVARELGGALFLVVNLPSLFRGS